MRAAKVSNLATLGIAAGGLRLEIYRAESDHVIEGILCSPDGHWFPIIGGVPLFLTGALQIDLSEFACLHGLDIEFLATRHLPTSEQLKTGDTFSDKWRRFKNYGFDAKHNDFLFNWYCKKLGLPETRRALIDFYRPRRRVLEVGPGSGFNTRFIAQHCGGEVFALDISDAAFTTFQNTRDLNNCTVVQADLMNAPFADEYFDLIIADGVIHHTPDTQAAMKALYAKVAKGGQLFFYVYRKMGAARQFCDAHIRNQFTKLSTDDCYAACQAITDLGRELSRLNVKITLEHPIIPLGIPAGDHDVQRLIYYNFLKCFWNENFDYETNNMVNFDWYHPHYAWQHEQDEVECWLRALGISDYAFNQANPNGISVLLTKPFQ